MYGRYLLVDSRPRRMSLVLPSTLPLPLLSTILTTIFTNFQPPTISLMSSPALTTAAAGLRSALVVDIGWRETIVTSIYEYREIRSKRSTRASKLLGQVMFKMLVEAIDPSAMTEHSDQADPTERIRDILSFEECEDILLRMAWCKPAKAVPKARSHGLESVQEEDEMRLSMQAMGLHGMTDDGQIVSIPLTSTRHVRTLQVPFSKLAEPCETALFASHILPKDFDDEELPIHLLVYRSLLSLPVDIRTMCMPRIIIVGGASKLIGLKQRVIDEVAALVEQHGWDAVRGRALQELHNNPKLKRKQSNAGPTETVDLGDAVPRIPAAQVKQERDPIEEALRREADRGQVPHELGYLRAVDSLGPWSGGSLLLQLKIPAVAVIDREQWIAHGVSGASRDVEVNINMPTKRQSMGPAAFKSGNSEKQNWSLGIWG